ncbi:protein phosphatase CheZ [Bordetella sp. 02P26C-1]|uniref:protein phosphatase CheZ n=1 Tax=Bordetella sp. 02P26C-1 TaxID=2683195 RepID=UPI00135434CA|nr:protein phosphatase CheZ [Bordetella sp. 02P26C-1]MVW78233.1 protein phosphatase CheZ [Bordetella sp. 02P26C-1]
MTQQQEDLIVRVGNVTRLLLHSMRELGLDKAVAEAAQAIPDTRDRLRYVAYMTEQAAVSVLNATEKAQPIQQSLNARASALLERMQDPAQAPLTGWDTELAEFMQQVVQQTDQTNQLLFDIMMAQGFQDLTGQVITKMIDMIGTIEKELLQVLVDYLPPGQPRPEPQSLINGPQVNPAKPDVVTGQDQVDDLLASLGL